MWIDFVNKIKEAKKTGGTKGLMVPTITTLIYSGAFDDSIDGLTKVNQLDKYREMYEDVKDALDSKAKLPAKRKGDILGVGDISGDISLALWRSQTNPLTSCDLLGSEDVVKWLKFVHAFEKSTHPLFKWRVYEDAKRNIRAVYMIDKWSAVFENDAYFNIFAKQYATVDLAVFGVVIDPEIKIYREVKERLTFRLFTGAEYTDELTMWPGKEGLISPALKETIINGAVGLSIIKPNKFAGKKTGTIQSFHRFVI